MTSRPTYAPLITVLCSVDNALLQEWYRYQGDFVVEPCTDHPSAPVRIMWRQEEL